MAVDPLADRLVELLEEGSVIHSRLSRPMRQRLATLFHIGALQDERAGGGRRVVLRDRPALESWITAQYPSGLLGTAEDLGARAESVANFRDSKRGRHLEVRLVHMRGFRGCVLRRGTTQLPLAELTSAYDVVGVAVEPSAPWKMEGVVAVVENLEVFMAVERVVPGIDAAIWAAGRLDSRVLGWLADQNEIQAVHVGDYDPVGLDEYLRLRAALGERADLHVPDDIDERVARYGQHEVLVRSLAVYKRVRRQADERVKAVLNALDRHGRGLEHEALFIAGTDRDPGAR